MLTTIPSPITKVLKTSNGELVDLPIPSQYAYSDPTVGRLPFVIVSEPVAELLLSAQEYLKAIDRKLSLLVLDCFRGKAHQASLYLKAVTELRKIGCADAADRYAANPVKRPAAGHLVGGAVDVVLAKTPIAESQTYVPYGLDVEDYDAFGSKMHADFLDDASNRPTREKETAWFRRGLIREAMIKAGAVPYPWEYSHFEIDTVFACLMKQKHRALLSSAPRALGEYIQPTPHGLESDLLHATEFA